MSLFKDVTIDDARPLDLKRTGMRYDLMNTSRVNSHHAISCGSPTGHLRKGTYTSAMGLGHLDAFLASRVGEWVSKYLKDRG